MKHTMSGMYKGVERSIVWEDGRLSGHPPMVREVERFAEGSEGITLGSGTGP